MSESATFGIGIVGCGRAAVNLHLPTLTKLPEARVVALADTDTAALEAAAGRFGVSVRAADTAGLLAVPGIDVVAVCVPAGAHVAAALPAIEGGRHVLVEKPLAPDRAGCERLIEAATRSGGRTAVGFNLRFHRLVRTARELIASGRLGAIEAISSTWTSALRRQRAVPPWRNDRATGGGALFEIAVHHFDLWRFLLDTDVEKIFTHGRNGEWKDETVAVTARLASGVLATGVFSERSGSHNMVDIVGREGRLSFDLFRYDSFEFTPADAQPGLAARLQRAAKGVANLPRGVALMRQGGDFLQSYRRQWQAFLGSTGGSPYPGASLADGYAAVRTVLAAIESADAGRPVKP